jgi:enamine deaminase RidA (YjgF/YER057c/UK114 family)
MIDATAFKREVLVEDERRRGIPAVVRFGPYVFVAGSDGYRRLSDEHIDPKLADDAVGQCRNAYGRVKRRLEAAGYGDDCAVWIENYTSGQHWRLERMALWPEYFGEENHLRAVSFGAQTRMDGLNMLTAVVMAVDPAIDRRVAVHAPARGRASRCTRVGPFTFVIGVRGHVDPYTHAHAPQETPHAFDLQCDFAINALESHLKHDENTLENFVRVDAAVRAARFVPRYEAQMRDRFGGKLPFAALAIGTPLGGTHEQEIGGIAAIPGEPKSVNWSPVDPDLADSTVAGGLVFLRNVSGLRDEHLHRLHPESHGKTKEQVRRAVTNVERLLADAGTSAERLLRFDIFLRDIYAQDEVLAELKAALGPHVPALSFIGAEPQHGAEIELIAIAGAASA